MESRERAVTSHVAQNTTGSVLGDRPGRAIIRGYGVQFRWYPGRDGERPCWKTFVRGPHRKMLRVVTLSTLFPNAIHPTFGIFVENQTLRLADCEGVDLRVVNPIAVPPFPFNRHSR